MINAKSLTLAITFAVVATAFLAPSITNFAFAKITSEDTSCENKGGNEPGGQQPSCKNTNGLKQNSENQNPAGKAPPGQNK